MNYDHLTPSLRMLNIFYHWKWYILINTFIVGLITLIITLLISDEFKSNATVMVPESNSGMGLGAISSLVSSSIPSIGSKLLGGNANTDRIMGILQSRMVHEKLINEFGLIKYYKTKGDFDKTLKAFRSDFVVDVNQNLMIDISYIHEDKALCANLINRSIFLLDSLNKHFGVVEAKNNRTFIEKRYLKNLNDLKSAEDSLNLFQKKFGVFSIDEQMKAMFKATAELEAELFKREIILNTITQTVGNTSNQYITEKAAIDQLKGKLTSIRSDNKLDFESTFIIPMKIAPDLGRAYFRFVRSIEIQSRILQVILPLYEQSLMEEQKSIPTILPLDFAQPATYKTSPKRLVIIVLVTVMFFLVLLSSTYIFYLSEQNSEDPFSKKISDIGRAAKKLYFVN